MVISQTQHNLLYTLALVKHVYPKGSFSTCMFCNRYCYGLWYVLVGILVIPSCRHFDAEFWHCRHRRVPRGRWRAPLQVPVLRLWFVLYCLYVLFCPLMSLMHIVCTCGYYDFPVLLQQWYACPTRWAHRFGCDGYFSYCFCLSLSVIFTDLHLTPVYFQYCWLISHVM